MKEVLERFEKACAAHGLTDAATACMRGLLADAHTAGYAKHMAIASDTNVDEDSMPGRSAEPDEPEDYETERMVKAVRKSVRKEVRKALRAQKKSMRKEVRKVVSAIVAAHPGAAALVG